MKFICFLSAVVLFMSKGWAMSQFENEVESTISKMDASNAESAIGFADDSGVFIICVGRDSGRDGVDASRERARLAAINAVASVLGNKTKSSLQMSTIENGNEVQEFFSSLSETTVEACLKGVRVLRVGKNAEGETVVIVVATAKAGDASVRLQKAMDGIGEKGVVLAVGVDSSRAIAEKNALRSAVEQVAGTMVAGKVSMTEKEDLHKRLATTAGALVEEYRITKESRTDADFRVEIAARVSKRAVYDSYRSFFKAIDNPTFYVESNEKSLKQAFVQYFVDKGFNLTERQDLAHYVIRLDGKFTERPNPITGKQGTMLSLSVSVASTDGKTILLQLTERKSKDSDVLTREQRIEAVSNMIFKKIRNQLDEKIHGMVIRMLDGADS